MATAEDIGKIAAFASGSSRKIWLVVALGFLIGLGIWAISYFRVQPYNGYTDIVVAPIGAFTMQIIASGKTMLGDLSTAVAQNPIQAAVTAVTATGAIIGLWSKITGDRARAQAEKVSAQAITEAQKAAITNGQQFNMAQAKVTSLETQLKAYKEDTFAEEARDIIGTKDLKITQLNAQVEELRNLVGALKVQVKEIVVVK